MSSRASAGGAGNSGGVANENRNLAWVAAYAAADVPLPIARTSGIRVEHVGGQTGMEVDDVGVITEQRGFVLIQAKKTLGLDKPPGSPLGKALDQVVEQYLTGVPDGSEQALDVELATTATVIVNRIRALPGWQPEWPGAADCGMAAAAITRTALADLKGPGNEYLGHRAADLLTDAIQIDPGQHGPLVARFADPAVMAAWGVSAACVLTRRFADIAAHTPGPAIDLAVAVWTFTEEREETTYLTPSRFKEFSGNRMADLEGARHDIGTAFSAVIERDPAVAVEMYLRVIEAAVPPPSDDLESALLSLSGGTLAGRGHGALIMMTDQMADYLDTLDDLCVGMSCGHETGVSMIIS